MIRIAIVEDNPTLRGSLESLFNHTEGMRCVATLNNLLNVISEVGTAKPDIILMDIGLPNISGIEGVRTVKTHYPAIQVLMFTVFDDDEKIFDAIRAGASGYLLKKTPPAEIVQAIYDLYHGGAPMTASIARRVIQSFQTAPSTLIEDYPPKKNHIFILLSRPTFYRLFVKSRTKLNPTQPRPPARPTQLRPVPTLAADLPIQVG
jgi:DNA-binding NarL/FixJ family response regulator